MPGTGRRKAGGVWRAVWWAAGGLWRVACGMWRVASGEWRVAGGRRRMSAEIMTSVDMVV
jgi:hypothetical protein